jgi:hypothetical protein
VLRQLSEEIDAKPIERMTTIDCAKTLIPIPFAAQTDLFDVSCPGLGAAFGVHRILQVAAALIEA